MEVLIYKKVKPLELAMPLEDPMELSRKYLRTQLKEALS